MPAMDELRLNPVYYGPEHLALRETLRRFVAKEITPYVNDWDEAGVFPRELYAQAAEVGLLFGGEFDRADDVGPAGAAAPAGRLRERSGDLGHEGDVALLDEQPDEVADVGRQAGGKRFLHENQGDR